jgi:hypothetical protein
MPRVCQGSKTLVQKSTIDTFEKSTLLGASQEGSIIFLFVCLFFCLLVFCLFVCTYVLFDVGLVGATPAHVPLLGPPGVPMRQTPVPFAPLTSPHHPHRAVLTHDEHVVSCSHVYVLTSPGYLYISHAFVLTGQRASNVGLTCREASVPLRPQLGWTHGGAQGQPHCSHPRRCLPTAG